MPAVPVRAALTTDGHGFFFIYFLADTGADSAGRLVGLGGQAAGPGDVAMAGRV